VETRKKQTLEEIRVASFVTRLTKPSGIAAGEQLATDDTWLAVGCRTTEILICRTT